jgi:hypothetical protein
MQMQYPADERRTVFYVDKVDLAIFLVRREYNDSIRVIGLIIAPFAAARKVPR